MKKLLSTLLILISIDSFGQTFKVDVESFDELKISRGIEAVLIHSNDKEMSFEVKGVSKSDIIIEQSRHRLSIKVKTKALWETMQENDWWVKVKIPYQELSLIDVSIGAALTSEAVVESDDLFIDSSMGGSIKLELKTAKLSVDTSMGSVINLTGQAKNVSYDANMGAVIKGYELKSKYANVESSMGAVVFVNCSYEFDGSASMGGEIKVKGNPEKSFESESMGGYIRVQ